MALRRGILMANATQSVTRLLGLNLTPGKLRGLQRISNANGTLTMVATDQNSSMIGMMRDAFKRKGEPREPTFHEVVEAKVQVLPRFTRHASAMLVDAYHTLRNSCSTFDL